MCVIVYKPKNVNIKKSYLRNCFDANSDGAGFMFIKEGKLRIIKGFFTFDTFWKAYNLQVQKNRGPFVIHFRLATSGYKDRRNCHPFRISKNMAFVHNGIFYDLSDAGSSSDTMNFRNVYLRGLPDNWLDNDAICNLVENYIKENRSKVVFMRNDGEIRIIGESTGVWHKRAWYSNNSYEKCVFHIKGFSYEDCKKLPKPYYPDKWSKLNLSEHEYDEYDYYEDYLKPKNTLSVRNKDSICVMCGDIKPYWSIRKVKDIGDICSDCMAELEEYSLGIK